MELLNSYVSNNTFSKIYNDSHSKKFIFEFNKEETINIINPKYEIKLKTFKDNPEKLMIVTDFDFTLTKNYLDNERLLSCINVMIYSDFISNEFQKISKDLHVKYAKYEYDTTIDLNLKDEMMHLWFKENLDMISKEKISKEDFRKMILQGEKKFYYRYGIIELFDLIEKNSIPIFIISAGIYEIIENSLKIILPGGRYQNLMEKNLLNIIANKFTYDEYGFINGYVEPIVYTFNKGEILKRIFKEIGDGNENILLMGDHINDIDSIKHIEYRESIKIGYLNFLENSIDEKKIQMVENYKSNFDVLLFADGNLTYVNNLIKNISEHGKSKSDI